MASGTKKKGKPNAVKAARASVVAKKGKPWGTIAAVVAVLLLAGGVFGYAYVKVSAAEKFLPADDNKDPSEKIAGVVRQTYSPGQHVDATQRVAYDQSPPFGGPHDGVWADCTGIVYPTAVRNENMVHTLEHGAIWIAYNPDTVTGPALDKLKSLVDNKPYMVMSPYPGLDRPISLQSWGHQLKLDSADDERIDQFIRSLRTNVYQHPEPGGRCDSNGTGFNPAAPPPFVAEQPGPDAIGMDGKPVTPAPPAAPTSSAPPTQ
ncbi:DUF3105 domain-containing protein [Actinokineospora iranica]|uniref:DUF3105 domain-containing protein n=1 Tax=Actinokineospora iranica TaxID=1271860 RepID=A0A1G6M7P4_9PSEU|nr:DUF3105 domain-containing protein [Actinokineospora iranica]SDC51523.1 Protein of unknown function [Actinokineospora iranica]